MIIYAMSWYVSVFGCVCVSNSGVERDAVLGDGIAGS